MRWFIEVSRLGEDTPLEKYCLEAKQWQAALQEARKRRGDAGPLSKFSIELLEQGYRAVDPSQKIRYVVNKAPPDASLSQPPAAPAAAAAPGSFPSPQVPTAPVIKSAPEPAASTDPMASPAPHSDPLASAPKTDPMAALPPESHPPRTDPLPHPPPTVTIPPDQVPPIGAGSPSSTTQPMTPPGTQATAPPAAPPRPASVQLTQRSLEAAREPDFQVVKKREEEPTEKTPMLYREYSYAVRPGTERASVEVLLWLRFREVRTALEGRTERKFLQLAVFDHVFEKKPARPPIATLMWKDWRGDPMLQFPDPSGPVGTLSPPAVTAPPPAVTLPPSTTQPAAALTEPASPPTDLVPAKPEPAPVVSQPF
ncbi:MAG: hypothetical protein IT377_30410, partial [Polyangiaceae bacterium]|nr:hypothetical protein [Polyangiaceae bacterium]